MSFAWPFSVIDDDVHINSRSLHRIRGMVDDPVSAGAVARWENGAYQTNDKLWFNLRNEPISLRHYHPSTTLKHLARFREGLFSFGGLAFVCSETGERLAPFAIPLSSLAFVLFCAGGIHFIRKINSACVMLAQSCFPPSIPNTLIADRWMLLAIMGRASSFTSIPPPGRITTLSSAYLSHLTPAAVPTSSTWLRLVYTTQRSGVRGATAKATEGIHPCCLWPTASWTALATADLHSRNAWVNLGSLGEEDQSFMIHTWS